MKTDLAKGNIAASMVKISGLLIVGNILQQMYDMIDALVIERYLGQQASSSSRFFSI